MHVGVNGNELGIYFSFLRVKGVATEQTLPTSPNHRCFFCYFYRNICCSQQPLGFLHGCLDLSQPFSKGLELRLQV